MKSFSYLAVFLAIILVSSSFSLQSFADVISPKQQMKLDFTTEQIICGEGLVKIIKKSTGNASCVKPATAEKLAQNGWAQKLSEQKIEEINMKKQKKGEAAGTITKIATLKQATKTVKAQTIPGTSGYAYVFEACAKSKVVKAPEIFVTSDSETRSVKLGSPLKANSCYTSSVIIKAADPNSISAILLNKGGISEKISALESQIADLKDKIKTAKQNLPKSGDQKPNSDNVNNIQTMKKDLKNLQDQLRRYLMVLYAPSNTKAPKLDVPKSMTGKPLDNISTEIITLSESVAKPVGGDAELKRFDVVFEACTGKDSLRVPIITVSSDYESVDVKLIDRIIPESCQVGVAKINAMDSESIMTSMSDSSGVSVQITDLEKQINELETQLQQKRSDLGLLFSKKLDSQGEQTAQTLVSQIAELRSDLLKTRAQLYGLMLAN